MSLPVDVTSIAEEPECREEKPVYESSAGMSVAEDLASVAVNMNQRRGE
jgi:hypothetical protein